MDSDFPWIYVAMVFIAFISWLRARLQEAAELRRVKALKKKTTQSERRSPPLPSPSSPYLHPSPQAARPTPVIRETVTTEVPVPEMPKTFRELFEVLQEQVIGQAEAPSSPPPLPVSPVPRVEVSVASAPNPVPVPEAPLPSRGRHGRKVARKTSGDLSRILKSRGTLREALIMKEILDTPVALKD